VKVETSYDAVWREALPYMRARKNDVHIPLSYAFAEELLEHHPEANRDVVLTGILLHDIGWAVVDQKAIYSEGFGPNMMESGVRIAHEQEGARLTREILGRLEFAPEIVDEVATIIEGHDTRPHALSRNDELVKDADKLWRGSTTGIAVGCDWFNATPGEYWARVKRVLDQQLFTDAAHEIAARELAESRRLLQLDLLP
jgi:HD domain